MRWAEGPLAGRGSEESAKKPRGLVVVGGVVLLLVALLYILLSKLWRMLLGRWVVAAGVGLRGDRLLKIGAAMGEDEDEKEHGLLMV